MPPDTANTSGMAMLQVLSSKAGIGSGLASSLLGVNGSGAQFIAILRSRTVEDRLINRFDLRKVYWYKTYEDTRRKLENRTDIDENRKTGVISIVVSDRDRMRSAALAQGYVDELNRLVAELTTSAAHRERVFLEQRLEVVHRELQDASRQFSEFSSRNGTLDIQVQGKAMVEAAATLQGQLIAAESELQGLEQIYTPQNVRVRSLRARVTELRDQLNKLGGKGANGTSPVDPNALYPSIRQLPVLGLQYAELFRRVKIQEAVFETLTQQYELAKVQEAKEIPSVKVLDAAQPPEKKSWPPRTLLVLGGTLLILVLASCWIVAGELWSEVESHEPHKEFLSQVWADTQPALQKRKAQLRKWMPRHRNGHEDTNNPDYNGHP
jgi:capsule polysaccharide export protein KpsE/RkpR